MPPDTRGAMDKYLSTLVLAVCLCAGTAHAQVTASQKAAAEALFDRGLALMREGKLDAGRYKDLRLHMVADDEGLAPFSASTKFNTDRAFLEQLFALGRTAADGWLAAHEADIGVRGTLDIDAEFLGGSAARASVQTPMPATAQELLEGLKDTLR